MGGNLPSVQQNPRAVRHRVEAEAGTHPFPAGRKGNLPPVLHLSGLIPEPGIRALVIIGCGHRNRLPGQISLKAEIPYPAQIQHHP